MLGAGNIPAPDSLRSSLTRPGASLTDRFRLDTKKIGPKQIVPECCCGVCFVAALLLLVPRIQPDFFLLDYDFLIYSFMFSSLSGDQPVRDSLQKIWCQCQWQNVGDVLSSIFQGSRLFLVRSIQQAHSTMRRYG